MATTDTNMTGPKMFPDDLPDYTPCKMINVIAFSQVFLPTLYSIVFTVGIIGNGLVVGVLVKYYKGATMSDLCLFNLAISDLLFLISLPFWAHNAANNEWKFGSFMCQTLTTFFMLGFYGNIFFMILITVDRYAVIVHAHNFLFSKHRSVRTGIVLALFIWTLSLVASLPTIIFTQLNHKSNVSKCQLEYERSTWKLVSDIELNLLGLIIPLSVMVFCYSRIIPIIMTIRSQKKHKAVKLLLVLVTVFFLFWTPYNIVVFLMSLHQLGYMQSCEWDQDLNMAMQWVEPIAFSHCCLNPIIYAFMGQKFRNLFLKILKEWFPCCFGQCSTTEREISEKMSTIPSHTSVSSFMVTNSKV